MYIVLVIYDICMCVYGEWKNLEAKKSPFCFLPIKFVGDYHNE